MCHEKPLRGNVYAHYLNYNNGLVGLYIEKYEIEHFKYVLFIVCLLHLVKLVNICIIMTPKFLPLILTTYLDWKFKYPTNSLLDSIIAFPVFLTGPSKFTCIKFDIHLQIATFVVLNIFMKSNLIFPVSSQSHFFPFFLLLFFVFFFLTFTFSYSTAKSLSTPLCSVLNYTQEHLLLNTSTACTIVSNISSVISTHFNSLATVKIVL